MPDMEQVAEIFRDTLSAVFTVEAYERGIKIDYLGRYVALDLAEGLPRFAYEAHAQAAQESLEMATDQDAADTLDRLFDE